MTKIKLTKGELKKQRDSLKQYQHYLPTLQLKKQQLQIKILEAQERWQKLKQKATQHEEAIRQWAGLFADPVHSEDPLDFKKWITPTRILTDQTNIAGANIPIFKEIHFPDVDYDFYEVPLWVDTAFSRLRELISFLSEMFVLEKQIEILRQELRITTQRVNLFEKIKIPECQDHIRRIRIYLGDQQANAVGISKVAKNKILEKDLEEALA